MLAILIFLLTSLPSASKGTAIYPYQNCNPDNKRFTESLASDFSKTEADFCFICSQNDSNREQLIDRIKSLGSLAQIPKECFLAMTARGNRLFGNSQYKYCEDKDSTIVSHRRKLCANEKYVEMIQKAFTDMSHCFNFDLERQAQNLALINQESGGILNVQSDTGARCMTQITKGYVADIIRNIKDEDRNNSKERQIYNEARQRCPWISNLILAKDSVGAANAWLTCQTTRDPHVCLFYKFIGLETNLRNIKKNLVSAPDYSKPKYMGTREFAEEDKIKYKLPLQTNEVLNVTVTYKTGDVKNFTFAYGKDGLFEFIRTIKSKTKDIEKIETRKTPLFKNDKDIQNIFYYLSHNGGAAYSRGRIITVVEHLKQKLAQGCSSENESERCALRRQIQRGESLSAAQALPSLKEGIGSFYTNAGRRNEVTNYVENLINNNRAVFGYDKDSAGTKMMINHYKKSVKFKDIELSDETATAFQKKVSDRCPKVNLVSP